MGYILILNDSDGTARFEDRDIAFSSAVFAPPAPPLDVSEPVPAGQVLFARFAAGWRDDAHPAPARQWMFVLSGRATVGGETRAWGPGTVFLLENTSPPGHATTVTETALIAVVRC